MQCTKLVTVLQIALLSSLAAPVEKNGNGPKFVQPKAQVLVWHIHSNDSFATGQIPSNRINSQTLSNLTLPINGQSYSKEHIKDSSPKRNSSEIKNSTEEISTRLLNRTPRTISDVFEGVERRHVGKFVKEATEFFGDDVKKFWEATDNSYSHVQAMQGDGLYEILNTYFTGLIKEEEVVQSNIIRNIQYDLKKATELEAHQYEVLQELSEFEKEELINSRNEISVLNRISEKQQIEIDAEIQQEEYLKNIMETNLQANLEVSALRREFSSLQNKELEEEKTQSLILANIEIFQRQQAANSEVLKCYQLVSMIVIIIISTLILFIYLACLWSSKFKVQVELRKDEV